MKISFDYETYSAANLNTVGAWRYAYDRSTELLCFAWSYEDDDEVFSWDALTDTRDDLQRLFRDISDGAFIYGWNVNFERAITERVAHQSLGFPIPNIRQWQDTQAIASMCALPIGLGDCAKVLNLAEQKDTEGKRLLNIFSSPGRKGRTFPKDDPQQFAALVAYCRQDVRTERAVHRALPIRALPKDERALWAVDSLINSRGVGVDLPLARGARRIVAGITPGVRKQISELTGGLVTAPTQVQRIKEWLDTRGYPLDTLEKAVLEPFIERDDVPDDVKAVCDLRLLMGKSTTAKYDKALLCACPDSRVRGIHRYHKAGTGRWGGTLIQGQNLARPSEDVSYLLPWIRRGDLSFLQKLTPLAYKNPMSVLRDSVRHMVKADAGNTLLIADLSAIEGRVLAWQAEEEWKLKAYKNGLDLYSVTASWIYNIPFAQVDRKLHRPLGKESDLGLGYSMGTTTFEANCLKKGLKVTTDLIKKTVKVWRSKNPKIVQSWHNADAAAQKCVLTGRPTSGGKYLKFEMVGTYLTMILPSGRRLWYPEATVQKIRAPWGDVIDQVTFKTWVEQGQRWSRDKIYGGKFIENFVQAIARDIFVNGIMLAEQRGIPVVMHVHDEVVAEVQIGEKVIDDLIECMTTVPDWAEGLPLMAEGFTSTYFKKGA